MATRRGFLKSGGALAVFGIGVGGIPPFVAKAASRISAAAPFAKNKVLICIFQRGAMDGLMAVSPFEDAFLQAARPTLSMSAVKSGDNKPLIDLDGRFGLHPSFQAFEPLFRSKQLAIVHGIGSPNHTRSHFDAQDFMESGTPFDKSNISGWLNRAAGLMKKEATPFRAVSLTQSMPRSFYGYAPALAISNLSDFGLKGKKGASVNVAARSFEDLYDETAAGLLQRTGKETFSAMKMLENMDAKNYRPANGAVYPISNLGQSLKQLAQLIKLNVGLEIGFAESGGWDTHYNQGTENGPFARNAADFSNSITAFWTDLGAQLQDDVTILTMTEFGRTVKQNGSGGTDHGRASCHFIIGNHVKGGAVYGDVKPLATENLEDGRDLAVTTDFRSLFSNVAQQQLKIANATALFPGWEGKPLDLFRK